METNTLEGQIRIIEYTRNAQITGSGHEGKVYHNLGLVHTNRLRLRLRQMRSMTTNDGVHTEHLHLTAKIKEKRKRRRQGLVYGKKETKHKCTINNSEIQ